MKRFLILLLCAAGSYVMGHAQTQKVIIDADTGNEVDDLYAVVRGLDEPSITDKIRLYWLGSSYDFEKQAMKNTDFNSVMDIQAVDVILNSQVELHIIPNNVSGLMTFNWEETKSKLRGQHELADYLLDRWYNHVDAGISTRTIWDLALIQAIIFPQWAEQVKIMTSKELGQREIWMYRQIDAHKMRDEFFTTTLKYLENLD